jgi:hypothetical protein
LIRFYLKIILLCILALLALNMAARTLGSTEPPNPALEGFTVGCEGKLQPCWYGIVPGVTTVEEATTIFLQHPNLFYRRYVPTINADEYVAIAKNSSAVCRFLLNLHSYIADKERDIVVHCSGLYLGNLLTWRENTPTDFSGRRVYYSYNLELTTSEWVIQGEVERIFISSYCSGIILLGRAGSGWSRIRENKLTQENHCP